MAGRIRNRLDLRRQAEAADQRGLLAPQTPPDAARGPAVRQARGQKGLARVCARWGVFDAAMKLVCSFGYNQRALAEQKVAELNTQRKGTYFLQMVTEAISESDPADLD